MKNVLILLFHSKFIKLDNVYYYTNFGEIMGIMKINSHMITFDPIRFNDPLPNLKKGM